jgi:hypothetical protein
MYYGKIQLYHEINCQRMSHFQFSTNPSKNFKTMTMNQAMVLLFRSLNDLVWHFRKKEQ